MTKQVKQVQCRRHLFINDLNIVTVYLKQEGKYYSTSCLNSKI